MAFPRLIAAPLTPIRAAEMEWEPLGTHGLRRKRLGHDPRTEHSTAIVEIPVGWRGGGIAHYHEAFEEVYMLSGSVTLDGRSYWHGGDYFYRPAFVVHGHDERSHEGALTIIRSDGLIELLLVHAPEHPDEYPMPASQDPRGHVKSLRVADVAGASDPAFPAEWSIRALSADPSSGARTLIADVPAGWTGHADPLGVAWEAIVLEGDVAGREHAYTSGDYTAGSGDTGAMDAVASTAGGTILIWLFGRT